MVTTAARYRNQAGIEQQCERVDEAGAGYGRRDDPDVLATERADIVPDVAGEACQAAEYKHREEAPAGTGGTEQEGQAQQRPGEGELLDAFSPIELARRQ